LVRWNSHVQLGIVQEAHLVDRSLVEILGVTVLHVQVRGWIEQDRCGQVRVEQDGVGPRRHAA
jgi:hypothetical protein